MMQRVKTEDGCRGTKLLLFSKGNIFSPWVGNIPFLFSMTLVQPHWMIQYKRAHMCALIYIHTLKYFIGRAFCSTTFPDCVFYALSFSWNVIQFKLQGSCGWKVSASGLKDQRSQMNQLIVQWNSNGQRADALNQFIFMLSHYSTHAHTYSTSFPFPFSISHSALLHVLPWFGWRDFAECVFATPYWSNSNKYALIVHYRFCWVRGK